MHLYEELGDECIQKLYGMFAFALWDDRQKTLLLARDRVGIKPLYYCLTHESLIFASEIKAILADPTVRVEVEPTLLDRFLTYFYMPGEETLFKNIHKLSPGHYLSVKNGRHQIKQYWDLGFPSSKCVRSFDQCVSELTQLLGQTIREHMISDVPVGVLLSGGVDSAAVLSFALEQTDKNVSTFTIGFETAECTDERRRAKFVAERFGTTHYETTITSKDFLSFLPKYVWHMEEPVCEPPAIALYYVSKIAREHVTVLLSGEGGDEAFAGYQNYRNLLWLEAMKTRMGLLVRPISKVIARLGSLGIFRRIRKYAPLMTAPLEKYYYSRASTPFEYFNSNFQELYTEDFLAAVQKAVSAELLERYFDTVKGSGNLDKMLYVDTKTWLPDDLLIKADKMTMANSLELRVPLLDHRILEFAASLPAEYKLMGTTTKYILKKALAKRVPPQILKGKKTGFPVPYEGWLKKDFKDSVWSILTDRKATQRGYFQKAAIERLLTQDSDHRNYSKEIFSLIIVELWHRLFVDGEQVVLS